MKELYISPELEILCFLPQEGIATEQFGQQLRNTDDGFRYSESLPGDYNEGVETDPFN